MNHEKPFQWTETRYKPASCFVEVYPGFTMDISNIETVKKSEYNPLGSSKVKHRVNATKKGGQVILVINTKDEAEANQVYQRLVKLAETAAEAFAKATRLATETTITHKSKEQQ